LVRRFEKYGNPRCNERHDKSNCSGDKERRPFFQQINIDLIFLDIKMPDISGVDFYNSLSKKPLLILTTAYSEHTLTSFEMDAID
jgi:two-component SAPR family response regulator